MGQSQKGNLVDASPNCRICGLDTSIGRSWKDANGHQYCQSCVEDLRKQPPYQSPMFKCDGCGHAWPLKALVEQGDCLTCKDCIAAPPANSDSLNGKKRASSNTGQDQKRPSAQARNVVRETARYTLGPPPGNILPRMTCPHCWHVFSTSDVLFVSQHGELLGDPVLGPEAALRFRPSRFNLAGEALDACNTPCQLLACPRCHLSIARGMTVVAPLFVSIIGAPASGKSHFLASMTWELRRVLNEKFAISFNDADGSSNHTLNEYEQTLFLQDDMDRLVSIRKTELQGELYDQIRLGEQVITLPKPFLFTLRPKSRAGIEGRLRMMCLYDNAGEHFQPGMDTVSLPGTQHMAKSRVLWFMYDPTQHPRFREQCRGLSQDPQVFGSARTIRQEVLLTEAASRIRRYTGLAAGQQYDRPLLVIVSKGDIWSQLLGVKLAREPLVSSSDDGSWAVDINRVEKISAALRKLLMLLSPEFVSAAEDFCKHVVYIPVSALGRGPEIEAETGMLAIRPRDVRPQWATVPFLYMFARWSAGLIPAIRCEAAGSTSADSKNPVLSSPIAQSVGDKTLNAWPTLSANGELYYTSAPRGLRQGSSGFCTVAMTQGMPAALVDRLESLSNYQPIFLPGSPNAPKNPVAFAHWRLVAGGRAQSVLSRIEYQGLDYTQRPNKLAYHIAVDPAQQPAGGPAWIMRQPGIMQTHWTGQPALLSAPKLLPAREIGPAPCAAWESATGDAGWAGVLAEASAVDSSKVSYIIYEPGFDPLPLLVEVSALLPVRLRWQLPFNTYFTELPAGLTCAWRCVVADSPAAKEASRYATSGVIIDLTRKLGSPPNSAAVKFARMGVLSEGSSGGVFAQTSAATSARTPDVRTVSTP